MSAGRDASLKALEKIVHPLVAEDRNTFIAEAAAQGEWLVVLDVPLLMETMDTDARAKLLDTMVVVSAPMPICPRRQTTFDPGPDCRSQFGEHTGGGAPLASAHLPR